MRLGLLSSLGGAGKFRGGTRDSTKKNAPPQPPSLELTTSTTSSFRRISFAIFVLNGVI